MDKMTVEAEDNHLHGALLIQVEDFWVPTDHNRKASDPSILKREEKRELKGITYFLLFDKKEYINVQREKLILWFPNSQRNYLKVTKMSLDNMIGILLSDCSQYIVILFMGFSYVTRLQYSGGDSTVNLTHSKYKLCKLQRVSSIEFFFVLKGSTGC